MAFNFFIRKKEEPVQQQEAPKKNVVNADLLLKRIELMHDTHYSVARHKNGKGEPRGYCRALKDIEEIIKDMKEVEA
ncbi:Hypothetical protein Tpal_488 [Trichococcus palustris]|uniref:Uncharacterized protein n=1 Tax=Trichococcus palustris TaxID=140314 RepID=A0A143YA70_9LACT|nr:hypothetical protein [Trichococcus palustris]CZQ83793.1 Hypothetical protein Tpal_488 [Trichococcus palustris]SFK70589.1 hypothetical protein SAMN04488076_103197 [Trichococcus palustris]